MNSYEGSPQADYEDVTHYACCIVIRHISIVILRNMKFDIFFGSKTAQISIYYKGTTYYRDKWTSIWAPSGYEKVTLYGFQFKCNIYFQVYYILAKIDGHGYEK